MLVCENGHRTTVHVVMESSGGEIIFSGKPDEELLRGILETLDEGACPICCPASTR